MSFGVGYCMLVSLSEYDLPVATLKKLSGLNAKSLCKLLPCVFLRGSVEEHFLCCIHELVNIEECHLVLLGCSKGVCVVFVVDAYNFDLHQIRLRIGPSTLKSSRIERSSPFTKARARSDFWSKMPKST